ncbi:MAG: cysteine--tRNA ligase [Phycisphaerales bacterium]|jgi:cysteinyl-tRNA synthetase|nr:cysteine--tRNA ligase [Phycisphaerales bacterium]
MPTLRLHNSLTRTLEPFRPRDPARVTFYSCGPTVYDDAHIGNFRSFLAADVLRRWIESPLCTLETRDGSEHRGSREVVHVMNITDVGHMTDDDAADGGGQDKMDAARERLAQAKKAGTLPPGVDIDPGDPLAIARFYEARFREDAEKLGLKVAIDAKRDPSRMPRATDNVRGMIAVIEMLIAKGHAYVVGSPGARVVYFRVKSFPGYGRLSGNTLTELRSGAGGRVDAGNQAQKEHPADFLLWKEDASHLMKWDSPWGAGYPGWHIECTVMSAARLLSRDAGALSPEALRTLVVPDAEAIIDLHSGGEDNIFPHHECEIAQTCCAFNAAPDHAPYAACWFHPRFLMVEGEKMSKSKGNFYTARDLFAKGHEPAAVRLALIGTHYRANANFTEQGLKDAARMVERWRRARIEIARRSFGWTNKDPRAMMAFVHHRIKECMSDDLNIAGAIGIVNEAVNSFLAIDCDESRIRNWTDDETIEQLKMIPMGGSAQGWAGFDFFHTIEPVLGVLDLPRLKTQASTLGVYLPGVTPSPEIEDLLTQRRDARAAKDWPRADQIRERLTSLGLAVKDRPDGTVEVRPA